jgi:hypothetical protein
MTVVKQSLRTGLNSGAGPVVTAPCQALIGTVTVAVPTATLPAASSAS